MKCKLIKLWLAVFFNLSLFLYLLCGLTIDLRAQSSLTFCGSASNDLYRLLSEENYPVQRFDNIREALLMAKRGDGIIVVADNYPDSQTGIDNEQYKIIKKKNIRVYIEYPGSVPGLGTSNKPLVGELERGVVTSDFFGNSLPAMSILGLNGCHLMLFKVDKPLISFAKVAGYNKAEFGLEGTASNPLLFKTDNMMVSATCLSKFKTARYGPSDSWRVVWEKILTWVTRDEKISLSSWRSDPHPMYAETEILPKDVRLKAIVDGTEWLWKARLFIHPSWEGSIKDYQPENGDPNLFFGPPIGKDMLVGDGSRGIMEGHASVISYDGTQKYRYFVRSDVQGETSFLLASSAAVLGNKHYAKTAERLLDYLFYTSEFRKGARNNKDSSSYALLSWANNDLGRFFNDNDARCVLGAIGASAFLNNERWNKFIVENILANFRITGKQGFWGGSLAQEDIESKGWKFYNERDLIFQSPHFESWMWACYIWLYDKTKYKPLLEKVKSAITIMMDGYPGKWVTQNGIQQERARMILPLAWLVRAEDTPQHRKWLDLIVSELLEHQQPNGAIREELGNRTSDRADLLILSNKEYGKNEASLIAKNGDPASDMLYTCNFAFFGLHEAAYATGNVKYKDAVKKLSDFLLRIQVKSADHIDVDGAWFRAFDYKRWDYWASNADNGWGAWCTLAGWIQAWIVGTQTLIEKNESYWDATRDLDVKKEMRQSLWMLK